MNARVEAGGRRRNRWSAMIWGGAAALLALPLVAMQLTREVVWTASDFVVMGAMLAIACGAYELAARSSAGLAWRAGAAVAILAGFLTFWVNLAVGMIGDEGNPFNLVFAGVILLALAGAFLARFRPEGMARAMLAAAVAQVLAAALGLAADPRGALFAAAFGLLWLLSAALFRKAARDRGR
jgi:hypothetical protein